MTVHQHQQLWKPSQRLVYPLSSWVASLGLVGSVSSSTIDAPFLLQQWLDHLWHPQTWQSSGSSPQWPRMPGSSNGLGRTSQPMELPQRPTPPEAVLVPLAGSPATLHSTGPSHSPPSHGHASDCPPMPWHLQPQQSVHMAMPEPPCSSYPSQHCGGSMGMCGCGTGGREMQVAGG